VGLLADRQGERLVASARCVFHGSDVQRSVRDAGQRQAVEGRQSTRRVSHPTTTLNVPAKTIMLAAVLSLAVFAAANTASARLSASSHACRPARTTTLLENRSARVYRYREDDSIAACAFKQGGEEPLDDPIDQRQAFPPPSLALAGPVVGWAVEDCFSDCYTAIVVMDLRYVNRTDAPPGSHRYANAGIDRRDVKVGSLRLRRNGGVAWITCPGHPFNDNGILVATQRPNCVHKGSLDRVVKLDSGSRRRKVLDRSRKIDPGSLRIKGDRISWLHGDDRRHARLR
jgi:hypothetical protein